MVNNDFLRRVPYENPPTGQQGGRIKVPGPRYWLDQVQSFITPENCRVQTQNCNDDLLLLNWTVADVVDFVQQLTAQCYVDSEWCLTSNRMWVDCDAYRLKFDPVAMEPSPTGPRMYVKFGFRPNIAYLVVISCKDH